MKPEVLFSTKAVWYQACNIAMGFFLMFYSFTIFNSSVDNVASTLSWKTNSAYIPRCNGIFILGEIIGCSLSPALSKRIGRRMLLIQANILLIVASLVTIIPYTTFFLTGRLLVGISCGCFLAVCPVFINEITPDPMAGKIGTVLQTGANIGSFFSFGLCLLLPTENFDTNKLNYN